MTIYIKGKPVGEIDLGMEYLERGQPAFAILSQPRVIPNSKTPPKKTGPKRSKTEWMLIGMEDDEQRKTRQAAERQAAMAKIMRKNQYSEVGISTREAGNRAAQIRTAGVC